MQAALVLEDFWAQAPDSDRKSLRSPAGPDDGAYIEFTSGSTGRPKGVLISHRSFAAYCATLRDTLSLGPDTCSLLTISINFDPHIRQSWAHLALGGRLVIAHPKGHTDPDYIMDLAAEHGVTFLYTVPTLGLEYYRSPAVGDCAALRHAAFSGERLPEELVALVAANTPARLPCTNIYGPTECTLSSTCCVVAPGEGITIGRPDHNVHCYVVDASMQPVPLTVPGELLLSGPRLAQGYIGRPDLTAQAFIENPCYNLVKDSVPSSARPHYRRAYRTGDLVRWRPDGKLEYLGRIDRQVKIDGVRVELGEVEAVMSSAPGGCLRQPGNCSKVAGPRMHCWPLFLTIRKDILQVP